MLRSSLSSCLRRSVVPILFATSVRSQRFCSSSSQTRIPPPLPREGAEENHYDSRPTASISIDRSGLYNPPGIVFCSIPILLTLLMLIAEISHFVEHSHEPSSDSELVKHLKSIIKVSAFLLFFTYYLY